jgi:hypothetical protein
MHVVPHAPQLSKSVIVLEHAPLQFVLPIGQETEHWPAAHTRPPPHVAPHVLQLCGSVCTLTQLPLHDVSPAPQVVDDSIATVTSIVEPSCPVGPLLLPEGLDEQALTKVSSSAVSTACIVTTVVLGSFACNMDSPSAKEALRAHARPRTVKLAEVR